MDIGFAIEVELIDCGQLNVASNVGLGIPMDFG